MNGVTRDAAGIEALSPEGTTGNGTSGGARTACLRCGSADVMRLEKAKPEANTCYRCRDCGHIFSPPAQRV